MITSIIDHIAMWINYIGLSVSMQNLVVDLEGLYSIHTEVLFSETFEFECT